MAKRAKKTKGFTLAELLIVVAIMAILAGIVTIAVDRYKKNLRLNEMDSIAKELYIVSQNQLSKANASGLLKHLDPDDAGTPYDDQYYIVYNGSEIISGEVAREYVLPFGSIDETIRTNGSYLIRYRLSDGVVTQVYYSDEYNFNDADPDNALKAGITDRESRKNYNGKIIGYYEGEAETLEVYRVNKPTLNVVNGNSLYAVSKINDENVIALVCVKGLISNAQTTFNISNQVLSAGQEVRTVFDDITSEHNHFVNVCHTESGNQFIPGEDIEIFVTVQKAGGVFSNVEESKHVITNSLFASLSEGETEGTHIAQISCFRHLENLDPTISSIVSINNEETPAPTLEETPTSTTSSIVLVGAEQTEDLMWADFTHDTHLLKVITAYDGEPLGNENEIVPVNINYGYNFFYDGKSRFIDGAVLSGNSMNAGLFGTVATANISNLELHNFNITTSVVNGNAGALFGAGTNITVDKVLVFNPIYKDEEQDVYSMRESALAISAPGGVAGGLGGKVTNGTITNSAAAVYVNGGTHAGGLLGLMTSGSVSNSYSGGHTNNGVYLTTTSTDAGKPNIVSSGKTGGLVGQANASTITKTYSTCSVKGNIVNTISNGGSITNSTGFGWICKDVYDDEEAEKYPDVMKEDTFFSGGTSNATVYDTTLKDIKYPFKTIGDIDETATAWFLREHVGDWNLTGLVAQVVNIPD